MSVITHYFPGITPEQLQRLLVFHELLIAWNARINIVSRKDMENLEIRHILYSLSIARIFSFRSGTRIMDVGTGGGLPGVPLAIFFPEAEFTLVDSIGKKIRVVDEITKELGLRNVTTVAGRAEEMPGTFDFITGRAVTELPKMVKMVRGKISAVPQHDFPNGILYLKGGDVGDELKKIRAGHTLYRLSQYFREPFFETKMVIHLFNIR